MKKTIKLVTKTLAVIIVIGVIYTLSANLVMYFTTKGFILTPNEAADCKADCILVLGAGVKADGTPSHMLEDRLLTAIDLYNKGAAPKLLMSGDHGRSDYDEVNCMKAYAIEHGVDEDDIFLDHAGFSTYESAVRAKKIFGAERVVVVTQKYHLYRALYDAKAFGTECVGVGADIRQYFGQTMRDLRETAARAKDFAYAIFKPDPTFLGEKISLEGSGSVTNG